MKKLAVSFVIALICSTVAYADNKVNKSAPVKYELGEYDFSFSQDKSKETVEVKNIAPVPSENPAPVQKQEMKSAPQQTSTFTIPSRNSLNAQKDIVNQVKLEEKKIEKETKSEIDKTQKTFIEEKAKTQKLIDSQTQKVEKEIKFNFNKTEQNINNKAQEEAFKIKNNMQNAERDIKLDLNSTEQKLEKKLKTEPNYNNPQKINKSNDKPINNKKNKGIENSPFDFKIMDVQVIKEDSRTIEKL